MADTDLGTGFVQRRRPYPSDIPDEVWKRIVPLLPPDRQRGRRRCTDLREVVNGINYRWTTGCTWRMLPHDFPPWETVYTYFRDWQHNGVLQAVRKELLRRPRLSGKRKTSPSFLPQESDWPLSSPQESADREPGHPPAAEKGTSMSRMTVRGRCSHRAPGRISADGFLVERETSGRR